MRDNIEHTEKFTLMHMLMDVLFLSTLQWCKCASYHVYVWCHSTVDRL